MRQSTDGEALGEQHIYRVLGDRDVDRAGPAAVDREQRREHQRTA
jgi:hypothetical protein